MKKTLVTIISALIILGIGNAVWACEEIDFNSYGTICVDIDKDGSTYTLDIDYDDLSLSHTNAYYYVLLPNKKASSKTSGGGLLSSRLTDNNPEFNYNYKTYNGYDSEIRKIKVYAIIGNQVKSTEVFYDFLNGEREDGEGGGGTSNEDLDNFSIALDDSTPAEDDEVTLTIKARDNDDDTISDYEGSNAEITIEYRTSSSSSRYTASSSYVTIDDKTPNFDNGVAETNITFKYEYEYKVTVTDDDEDVDNYKIFDVGGGGGGGTSNGELDNFYITTDDSTPSVDQRVDLNIRARDNNNSTITDYTDRVNFKVYYRGSSFSSRTQTTSSSYYEIDADYDDGYDFTSSDDGYATLSNVIRFKKDGYDYKVRVYDEDNSSIYKEITFDVGSTFSSSEGEIDNFYVTSNDSSPDTNEWVDLTIKARDSDNFTVTDYTNDVEFTIYYRTSSSTTRTKTTSSNYYILGSSYEDGYDFPTSDYGIATLDNFIKFKQQREYKIVIEDANDKNINGSVLFDLRNQNSDVDGFTEKQLDAVQNIYNSRSRMISNLKSDYPKLRNNTTWIDKSDTFYDNMKDVIDDASNKEFEDYADYLDAFKDRYNYTIDHR